ncbi:MAG: SusD/RagB family nutrient-binding outer membrane lipoprotein [Cyclobacteriaceae bacterium]|jgi:hypothetical protein|nr:SusD/RagB family nutrient-binding outer membrane lipoprotein [Cyclobacteriaceae bacterium]
MKFIKSTILALFLVLAASCTLELQEDPNAVQPSQALPNLVLNNIQLSFAGWFNGVSTFGMQMTRLMNSGGSIYQNVYSPESFDGTWSTAYANILNDSELLIANADANGLARHAGMTRVISAYMLVTLVDFFGDVPYSEAFTGSGNFNPKLDDSDALYNLALEKLEKAIEDLTTLTIPQGGYLNPGAPTPQDLYYANNYGSWVRAANSIRLKIYLNLGDAAGINAVVAHPGGLIVSPGHNFVFRYGTNQADPDARHPRFNQNYLGGGGAYMSNWLMWHMFHAYNAQQNGAPGDPRIRFYFYRQTSTNNTDPNNIRCVVQTTPLHYPQSTGTAIVDNATAGRPPLGVDPSHPTNDPAHPAWGRTFCYPTDRGYWGRDHIDPQGIPPDNFLRTAWGVYPSGGRFDANVNAGVAQTQGMRGGGMQPIMMRSFVQFMLSEAALTIAGVNTGASARDHYEDGIVFSMDDVRSFSVNGNFGFGAAPPTEATTINTFYPIDVYNADRDNYVTSALAAFDDRVAVSADEAMNYVGREFWVASFCNGVEAYNLYRRTGKPTGMQPVINPAPGAFPRSFWYPANAANLNRNIEQKTNLEGRVFWDTNTTNLDF